MGGSSDSHLPKVHCCLPRRLEKVQFYFRSCKLKRVVEEKKRYSAPFMSAFQKHNFAKTVAKKAFNYVLQFIFPDSLSNAQDQTTRQYFDREVILN